MHATLQQICCTLSLAIWHTPDAHSDALMHRLLSLSLPDAVANTHEPVSSHVAPASQPWRGVSVKQTLPIESDVSKSAFSRHVVERTQPVEPHDTSGALALANSLLHSLSLRHVAVSSQKPNESIV